METTHQIMGEGQTIILYVDLLSISIFSPSLFQFIFFFQIPRLPELLLSLQDYQFLEDLFTGQHSVTTNLFHHYITQYSFFSPVSISGSKEQSILLTRHSGGLQVHLLQTRSTLWTHQLLSLHVLLTEGSLTT